MTEETEVETLGLNDAPEPIEAEVTDVAESVEEEQKSDELAESSTVEEEKPKADPVQKRIDELTRKRREAERDSQYWRDQAMKNQPEKPAAIVDESLKTLEDFDYDENAFRAHLTQGVEERAMTKARQMVADEQTQVDSDRKTSEFRGKELAFSKTIDDYSEVVTNPSLDISQAMADVCTQMDNGPEVLYYLGKHPEFSTELANLPPLLAARELGRIEAKIHLQKEATNKVSNAPKPAPKISTGDPSIKKSWDDMSQKEFNAERRKQIANR